MGYYPENDEEFYSQIESQRESVKGMDIPESSKNELYELIDQTVVRHEELKKIEDENIPERLGNALEGMFKPLVSAYQEVDKIKQSFYEMRDSVVRIAEAHGELVDNFVGIANIAKESLATNLETLGNIESSLRNLKRIDEGVKGMHSYIFRSSNPGIDN